MYDRDYEGVREIMGKDRFLRPVLVILVSANVGHMSARSL